MTSMTTVRRRNALIVVVTLALAALAMAVTAPPAQAVTKVVDCDAGDDLQGPINNPANDIVEVSGTCTGNFTIARAPQFPVTIDGLGSGVIDGNDASTVLRIDSGIVTLRNITLANGNTALPAGPEFEGGGLWISQFATVTMVDGLISGNTSENGGGIYNLGTFTMTRGAINANSAVMTDGGGGEDPRFTGFGGGVWNFGTATFNNASVGGNSAPQGGGIYNVGPNAVVTFNGTSSVANNTTPDAGGGIHNDSGTVNVESAASIGPGNTALKGGGIFNVKGTVNLKSGSIVTGNRATSQGGGVFNTTFEQTGTLKLTGATVSNNCAGDAGFCTGAGGVGGQGGGVYTDQAAVTDIRSSSVIGGNNRALLGGGLFNVGNTTFGPSTVNGNTAAVSGGGVYNATTMSMTDVTISNNVAATREGGGIFNDTGGMLTVIRSTLNGNQATTPLVADEGGKGGAIRNFGTATITNSTLAENTAAEGGGAYNDGSLTLRFSTVTKNTGNSQAGGVRGNPGKEVQIEGSIVAANVAVSQPLFPDCQVVTSLGGNVVGVADPPEASCGVSTSLFDKSGTIAAPLDPKLDTTLKNNGGVTATYALLASSPAIDNGGQCSLTTDQALRPRPVGLGCDSGSYEISGVPIPGLGPFTTVEAFIDQQYVDFLNRPSDQAGRDFWAGRLRARTTTGAGMIESFLFSAEFGTKVAPLVRLYFAYFLRFPDFAGLQFWLGQFNSGVTLNQISNSFAGSSEFQNRYGSLTNGQFVELVYQNVLGRAADAAGLAFWTGKLNSGQLTRGQVMIGFSESSEFKSSSRAEVNVTMVYAGMLRRAPDQSGFTFWVGNVEGGASIRQLINGFLGSAEYANRFAG